MKDIYVLIEHYRGGVADISYMMLAQANQLAQSTGGKTIAVLLGHQASGLAKDLAADAVWYCDAPALADFTWDAYLKTLAGLLQEKAPRLMLLGDTTIGAEVAGGLSARLGLPLVSNCRSLHSEGGSLKFIAQICGGKMMTEGSLPEQTALVTMLPGVFKAENGRSAAAPPLESLPAPDFGELRVSLKQYIEPDSSDIDISSEPVLVAVGRGVQNEDNLELVNELAQALGGAVCATRPVIDQGWLPTTRLVGKSGKTVKPKVYLALGISGAPEHSEAITGSELIIAINTDPAAPIFDQARYGSQVDMLDLLPALTEKIQQIKKG